MAATTLADRALIRLCGEDVHGFLQGLVTVDMAKVTATAPSWGGLLSPQGKLLFDFVLWGDGPEPDGDVFIDCEKEQTDEIVRRFGDKALVAVSLALVASRMYPTLKYAMGYGKACSRVKVAGETVAPLRLVA